jgi:tetratricopeptide (TPR) repeat protein
LSRETGARLVFVAALSLASPYLAAAAQEPPADDELTQRLTTVRDQIENLTFDVSRREQLTLDMAGTLDRAAQSSADPETRRRRWQQAIDLFDWFLKQNPDPPRERQVRFQAAVYRWAQARSWSQAGALVPRDPKPRGQAAAALDDAIERFRAVAGGGNTPALADNLSFRLAEALADRAELEPAGSDGRRSREREALALLEKPTAEPALAGYWHLLEADLLRRIGNSPAAQKELDAAISSTPAPPPREIVEVRIPLLLEDKKVTQAKSAVESSQLDRPAKALWMVRICLAQLAGTTGAPDRFAVESDLFHWIKELKGGATPESRQALLELGTSSISPDVRHPLEVWEALADAYGIAGDPAKAGAQILRAAEEAAAVGRSDAAAEYRLRGGGFLFQAGKYLEAGSVLSRVSASSAPAPLRAKAGMLACLAQGRALALGLPGASRATYATALQTQIRDFAQDPATDEARWLLGNLSVAESDRDRAVSLWSSISAGSPRWLESRLAILTIDRDQAEREALNPDRRRLTELFERADRFVAASLSQARSETDKTALLLARARLELTPGLGRPDAARELCERVARLPGSPDDHYHARLYRLVALAQLGRYVDAEREARSHSEWRVANEMNALLDAIRLLDQVAATAETDLRQRRVGLILRVLLDPLLASDPQMTPEQSSELAMRQTRALLFVGADREARRSIQGWREVPQGTGDRLLRDLGDTYSRLEAYTLEIDVQRLRLKHSSTGSPVWFDARYALALAYFRTGKLKESARLIDATAILHPELGGRVFHDKFIRLRQRLGVDP